MSTYFLIARLPYFRLFNITQAPPEGAPMHEDKGSAFHQVDSRPVAEQLLALFEGVSEGDRLLCPIYAMVEATDLDVRQRVLCRESIARLEELLSFPDWDYDTTGFIVPQHLRLLAAEHRQAQEWEPLVREELGLGNRDQEAPPAGEEADSDMAKHESGAAEARIQHVDSEAEHEILSRELFADLFVWQQREKRWQRELGLHAPTTADEVGAIIDELAIPARVVDRVAEITDMMDNLDATDAMLIAAIKNDRKTAAERSDKGTRAIAGQKDQGENPPTGAGEAAGAMPTDAPYWVLAHFGEIAFRAGADPGTETDAGKMTQDNSPQDEIEVVDRISASVPALGFPSDVSPGTSFSSGAPVHEVLGKERAEKVCRALNDLCQQHGWSESPVFSCVAVFDLDDEERMHQRAALAKLREMAQGKTPVYDNPLGAFLVRCHRECLAMDAAAQSEPKAQGERQGPSAGKSGLSKEALAIAALKDHPEWSDAEIAQRIELDLHEGGHEARVESGLKFLTRWLKPEPTPGP